MLVKDIKHIIFMYCMIKNVSKMSLYVCWLCFVVNNDSLLLFTSSVGVLTDDMS